MATSPTSYEPQKQADETFLQRQNRVYTAAPTPAPTTSPTTPVTSTGRIAPPTTQQPQGGTSYAPSYTGGMTPEQIQAARTSTPVTPMPSNIPPQQPPAQMPGVQQGAVDPKTGVYTPGQVQAPVGGWATYNYQPQIGQPGYQVTPLQQYQSQQVQQFQQPNFGNMDATTQGMVQNLLQNPYSMTPQMVEQLKGTQQDQAAQMMQERLGTLNQGAASRGMDPSSGYAQSRQAGEMARTQSDLLGAYRGIDMQKSQQDRQDLLQAMQAAGDWQNSAMGRAVSGYNTQLAGLGAQRAENQLGVESQNQAARYGFDTQRAQYQDQLAREGLLSQNAQNQYQSQLAAQQAQAQLGLQNEGLQQGGAQSLQQYLAQKAAQDQFAQQFGWGQETWGKEFGQRQSEFDRNLALQQAAQRASAGAASAANARAEEQLAFQYWNAQQNQQNSLLGYLMGGGSSSPYVAGGGGMPPY